MQIRRKLRARRRRRRRWEEEVFAFPHKDMADGRDVMAPRRDLREREREKMRKEGHFLIL